MQPIEKDKASPQIIGILKLISLCFGFGLILFGIIAFMDARRSENWMGQPATVKSYETHWSIPGGRTYSELWVIRKLDNKQIVVRKQFQEFAFQSDIAFLKKNIINIDPLKKYKPGDEIIVYSSPNDKRHIIRKGASLKLLLIQLSIGFILLAFPFVRRSI